MTEATGATGTGWIHITAYPGEDVHYITPNTAVKGGIQGDASSYGHYISISNLHLESSANAISDAAPINVQEAAGPWRIVNNDLGPWPSTLAAPGNAKAGGIASSGMAPLNVYGNYIHDIECAKGQVTNPLENHGIYLDSDSTGAYDIAFNNFQNIPGGSGLQLYNAVATTNNVTFHHNILNGIGKHGINVVNFGTGLKIYDNLITNTQYGGMRFDGSTKSAKRFCVRKCGKTKSWSVFAIRRNAETLQNRCRPETPFPACIRCMAGLRNRLLSFRPRGIIFRS